MILAFISPQLNTITCIDPCHLYHIVENVDEIILVFSLVQLLLLFKHFSSKLYFWDLFIHLSISLYLSTWCNQNFSIQQKKVQTVYFFQLSLQIFNVWRLQHQMGGGTVQLYAEGKWSGICVTLISAAYWQVRQVLFIFHTAVNLKPDYSV